MFTDGIGELGHSGPYFIREESFWFWASIIRFSHLFPDCRLLREIYNYPQKIAPA